MTTVKRPPVLLPDGCWGLPLTQGRMAIIDAEDLALVGGYNWSVLHDKSRRFPRYYAVRGTWVEGEQHSEFLHRLLLGLQPDDGLEADHKDNDGLNNRRLNLRVATRQQNSRNVFRHDRKAEGLYKGVSKMPTKYTPEEAQGRTILPRIRNGTISYAPNRNAAWWARNAARYQQMLDMVARDLTLQEMGEEFGFTRERARQMLVEFGILRPHVSRRVLKCRTVDCWEAKIKPGKDQPVVTVSGFATPEEAAICYDVLARRYFGEFAALNCPEMG
jgi:hypothetical protein